MILRMLTYKDLLIMFSKSDIEKDYRAPLIRVSKDKNEENKKCQPLKTSVMRLIPFL